MAKVSYDHKNGERTEIKHESFGNVQVSRVSGHASLFMSPHKHQHYITLSIHGASVRRDLSHDWAYSDHRLPMVEIAMSEAQWAHMVASAGMGSGTSCTIKKAFTENWKVMAEPPSTVTPRPTFSKEMRERGELAAQSLKQARDMIKVLLAAKKAGVGDLTALDNALAHAYANITINLEFVMESAETAMDKLVEAAKTEVEAHQLASMNSVALAAIAQNMTEEDRQRILDAYRPVADNATLIEAPKPEDV